MKKLLLLLASGAMSRSDRAYASTPSLPRAHLAALDEIMHPRGPPGRQ